MTTKTKKKKKLPPLPSSFPLQELCTEMNVAAAIEDHGECERESCLEWEEEAAAGVGDPMPPERVRACAIEGLLTDLERLVYVAARGRPCGPLLLQRFEEEWEISFTAGQRKLLQTMDALEALLRTNGSLEFHEVIDFLLATRPEWRHTVLRFGPEAAITLTLNPENDVSQANRMAAFIEMDDWEDG